jgi:hypothetical protein
MAADPQYTQNLVYPDLQIKTLDGDAVVIRKIALMLESIAGVAAGTSYDPVQYTPNVSVKNSSGTVSAGAKQVTFTFQTGFNGTVGGQTYSALSSPLVISAPVNATLAAIPYTVTAGSVQIVSLT